MEAWAEWRRTGIPNLQPSANAMTPSLQIPRRQAYGTTEANLNTVNHQELPGKDSQVMILMVVYGGMFRNNGFV